MYCTVVIAQRNGLCQNTVTSSGKREEDYEKSLGIYEPVISVNIWACDLCEYMSLWSLWIYEPVIFKVTEGWKNIVIRFLFSWDSWFHLCVWISRKTFACGFPLFLNSGIVPRNIATNTVLFWSHLTSNSVNPSVSNTHVDVHDLCGRTVSVAVGISRISAVRK